MCHWDSEGSNIVKDRGMVPVKGSPFSGWMVCNKLSGKERTTTGECQTRGRCDVRDVLGLKEYVRGWSLDKERGPCSENRNGPIKDELTVQR